MLGIDLKVDDFSFSNLFVVNEVQRPIYSVENTVESNGNLVNGSQLLASKISESKINMLVTLISDVLNDHNSVKQIEEVLKKYLPYRSLAKISFSDDPDWYYLGKLDGDASINVIDENLGTLNLTFLVPDGIKHAFNPKGPYIATQDADGRYSVTVVNDGTVDVPITLTATMHAENGYIGMYTDYGVTEIGNKEEDDTEDYVDATTLINTDDPLSVFKKYTGPNPENSSDVSNSGAASTRIINGRKHMYLSDAGTNTGKWHGASYVYDFPPDGVENIGGVNAYAYFNAPFWAGAMGQVGQIQVHFATEDNEFICGFHLSKSDSKGNGGAYYMRYRDSATSIKTFKSAAFTTSHLNTENPHNLPRADSDMRKRGAEITFYWFGGYPKITVPYLATKKVAKMYLNLYTLGNYPKMSYFDFRKVTLSNDSASYNRDIKNRFQPGSTVKMTGADSKVYVNDMPKLSEKVDGSNLFTIPPGETTIYFQCSDWCEISPTYQIEFQEANL